MRKILLVFATHNLHKIKEIKALLPSYFHLKGMEDIGCTEEIEETAPTLEGNAMLKANFIKEHYGYDCFSDDTGLEVYALNMAPGVHSARYAGPKCSAEENILKLMNALKGEKDRRARFRTVIALRIDAEVLLFEGIVEGVLLNETRGLEGFGYDPLFVPDGYTHTFAEMSLSQKNKISHRARALNKLIAFLNNYPSVNT